MDSERQPSGLAHAPPDSMGEAHQRLWRRVPFTGSSVCEFGMVGQISIPTTCLTASMPSQHISTADFRNNLCHGAQRRCSLGAPGDFKASGWSKNLAASGGEHGVVAASSACHEGKRGLTPLGVLSWGLGHVRPACTQLGTDDQARHSSPLISPNALSLMCLHTHRPPSVGWRLLRSSLGGLYCGGVAGRSIYPPCATSASRRPRVDIACSRRPKQDSKCRLLVR